MLKPSEFIKGQIVTTAFYISTIFLNRHDLWLNFLVKPVLWEACLLKLDLNGLNISLIVWEIPRARCPLRHLRQSDSRGRLGNRAVPGGPSRWGVPKMPAKRARRVFSVSWMRFWLRKSRHVRPPISLVALDLLRPKSNN